MGNRRGLSIKEKAGCRRPLTDEDIATSHVLLRIQWELDADDERKRREGKDYQGLSQEKTY